MKKTKGADMHPSGLTLARWNWPFKTPEERKVVAAWFAKQARLKTKQLPITEPSPY